jgi:hypothetical protein
MSVQPNSAQAYKPPGCRTLRRTPLRACAGTAVRAPAPARVSLDVRLRAPPRSAVRLRAEKEEHPTRASVQEDDENDAGATSSAPAAQHADSSSGSPRSSGPRSPWQLLMLVLRPRQARSQPQRGPAGSAGHSEPRNLSRCCVADTNHGFVVARSCCALCCKYARSLCWAAC